MVDIKDALIFIFERGKIRTIALKDEMDIGEEPGNDRPNIILEKNNFSSIEGTFVYTKEKWIYQNKSINGETFIDGKELEKGYGAILENNSHILITNPRASKDEDIISILFTTDLQTANKERKILDKKEIKNNKIASKLHTGSFYHTSDEKYIKHYNICAYQKIRITKNEFKPNSKNSDDLSIRIRERLGDGKYNKRKLLKNINIDIKPSEMVLIIGGSGAGKTTFINAVSGYEKADATIIYKGIDLYENSEKARQLVRLVPQFDTLRDDDTVRHTLRDVSLIQLPRVITSDNKELDKKVDNVLEIFGLEKEKNNYVKKISGGQRKRLSIATEYISQPEIFFLDEPDSGLDAGSAESVMHKVREIVDEGKIAIIISHSPDRLNHLYNKVLVIAKDSIENCGQIAFYGKIDEALKFFDVNSLEDIVKEINIQEKADMYIKKYSNYRGEDL